MKLKIPYPILLLGPSLFFFLGLSLNAIVVAANRHTMPVLTSNCEESMARWESVGDPIHACMTPQTHLKFLADWFYIPTVGTASIGDGFETVYEYGEWPAWFLWIGLVIADYNKDRLGYTIK